MKRGCRGVLCALVWLGAARAADADDYLDRTERNRSGRTRVAEAPGLSADDLTRLLQSLDAQAPPPAAPPGPEGVKEAARPGPGASDQERLKAALRELAALKAKPPPPGAGVARLADRLSTWGFSLRRGLEGPAAKKGAILVYTHDVLEDDDAFRSEFAFKYNPVLAPRARRPWRLAPLVGVAGNLTSEKPKDTNGYAVFGGVDVNYDNQRWTKDSNLATRRLYLGARLIHEEAQNGSILKTYGAFTAEPKIGAWALGVRHGLGPRDGCAAPDLGACSRHLDRVLSWQWDLAANVALGTVEKNGAGRERDDILAVEVKSGVVLYLDWLGRRLGWAFDPLSYPLLSLDYTARWMPDQADTYVDLLTLGLKIPITEYIGVEVIYENGAKGPSLDEVEAFEVALSVGF